MLQKSIEIASSDWRKDNHMVRVHCPTNGDVRDIQITIDNELITLGENASYSVDRNDVFFPLKKTYVHRDISELVEIMKELSGKQSELATAFEQQQNATEQLRILNSVSSRRLTKIAKWQLFFLFLLTGGVTGILIKMFTE